MQDWSVNSYHERQYDVEYDSTRAFRTFLNDCREQHGFKPPKTLIDVGCGAGANTRRLANWFPDTMIKGIDHDRELVDFAIARNSDMLPRLTFEVEDALALKEENSLGLGITAIQTLSWIPSNDIYRPIISLLELNPEWLCFSALGFDGHVDAKIQINDFSGAAPWSTPYNILSNNKISFIANQFEFDCLIIQKYSPQNKITKYSSGMSSYTEEFKDGRLELFSGPLYLPWYLYFIGKRTR